MTIRVSFHESSSLLVLSQVSIFKSVAIHSCDPEQSLSPRFLNTNQGYTESIFCARGGALESNKHPLPAIRAL